jgi:hypothetical protein
MLVAFGCNNGNTKYILPLDSMKIVMFDFLVADQWNTIRMAKDTNFVKAKNNLKSYQQVLAVHRITKAVFDSSLHYYEQRPDIFKVLIDSVSAYGSRLRDNAAPKPASATHQKKPLLDILLEQTVDTILKKPVDTSLKKPVDTPLKKSVDNPSKKILKDTLKRPFSERLPRTSRTPIKQPLKKTVVKPLKQVE